MIRFPYGYTTWRQVVVHILIIVALIIVLVLTR